MISIAIVLDNRSTYGWSCVGRVYFNGTCAWERSRHSKSRVYKDRGTFQRGKSTPRVDKKVLRVDTGRLEWPQV